MSDDEYEVGYGKPPKETQFQKGQSGNPNGRPQKFTSPVSVLTDPVSMTIDGKKQSVSKFEASLRKTTQSALEGRLPAIKRFIKHCTVAGLFTQQSRARQSGVLVAEYTEQMYAHIEMTPAIQEYIDDENRRIRKQNVPKPPEPKTEKDRIVTNIATTTHFIPQLGRQCTVIELVLLKLQERAFVDKDESSHAYFEQLLTKSTVALDTKSAGVMIGAPGMPLWMTPYPIIDDETGERIYPPKPGEPDFDPDAKENQIWR